jgi:hypothetical protein
MAALLLYHKVVHQRMAHSSREGPVPTWPLEIQTRGPSQLEQVLLPMVDKFAGWYLSWENQYEACN